MKRLTPWLAITALIFAFNPTFLRAESSNDLVSMDKTSTELTVNTALETNSALLSIPEAELAMASSATTIENAASNTALDRLSEINDMDMSAMNSSEKNELRKEVRDIQKDLKSEKAPSGGIYISVGGAILIVLLLILLL
jgi:hypothetical protein